MKVLLFETDHTKTAALSEVAQEEGVEVGFVGDRDKLLGYIQHSDVDIILCSPSLSRFQSLCRTLKLETEKPAQGEILIDHSRRKVFLQGQELVLTMTEYKILLELTKQPGRVIDRNQLANAVLRTAKESSRSLDVHVFSLRKKLSNYGKKLKTIRGVGYALEQ